MRRVSALVLPVVAVGLLISLPAVAAKRPITLDDHSRLREVADPQRSPDGAWVAYTVRSIDVEKDKRDTDIWMARWDGSEEIRLTSSPENESDPRWSPDGKYLAFLASRGDEEEKKKGAQVWLLHRAGGEAVQLTDIQGGVDDLVWSPDSTRLALVVSDYDPADEPEKMEGWKRKTEPPIVLDRYHFKQDIDSIPILERGASRLLNRCGIDGFQCSIWHQSDLSRHSVQVEAGPLRAGGKHHGQSRVNRIQTLDSERVLLPGQWGHWCRGLRLV